MSSFYGFPFLDKHSRSLPSTKIMNILFLIALLPAVVLCAPKKTFYRYDTEIIFVNITSFTNEYLEVRDKSIHYLKPITHNDPIEVLYFFAREKDHARFDQMPMRIPFCDFLEGQRMKNPEPIFHFNMDDALGIPGQRCPIQPGKHYINFKHPSQFNIDRPITSDVFNFFFDVFVENRYEPLVTVWTQFDPTYKEKAKF